MKCRGTNVKGKSCSSPVVMPNGLCHAHQDGGREHLRAIASKGAAATRQAWEAPGFEPGDLDALESLEDAKRCLDQIRRAVLTRRITHGEANAASKSVSEWCRAEGQAATARIVSELRDELASKAEEIEALRRQLAGSRSGLRAAR